MKKYYSLILLISILFYSCSADNDIAIEQVSISLEFTHNWEGTSVTNTDFNDVKFTNENGEQLSIVRLRYLISKVTLTNQNGAITELSGHGLIDVTNDNLIFSPSETIPTGSYSNIEFTFGFEEEDNIDGSYADLNTASFNVPAMLNGGYHYMQFDGKFLDTSNTETSFNYHTISAIDISDPADIKTLDTSFEVSLGSIEITNNASIEVKADLSEWFKDPNTWGLNELNTVLMPNYDAQILMSANGKTVFSLGEVTQ
jgi:hypothetical protein